MRLHKIATATAVSILLIGCNLQGSWASQVTRQFVGKPLRIAAIDPFSGAFATLGSSELAQMRFDAARINARGGIDGHRLEIVEMDNDLSPAKSLTLLHRAENEGIHYIAQFAGDAVGSALLHGVEQNNEINPKKRIIYFNYGAIGDEFTNSRCSFWEFSFDPDSSVKMNALTDWVVEQPTIHKVYLFNQNYNFGRALARQASAMLKAKDPNIRIVGNAFVPLAKVKDFTPYVLQIKESGANAVITGNWGTDLTLLVKAAAEDGLKIPFITYYGNQVGTVTAVGKDGVDRVYAVSTWYGDYNNPVMAKREVAMYKKTGFDYEDMRLVYMFGMLRRAAQKAHSIDPMKVAYAMEGLTYKGPVGPVTMRVKDHEIQAPLFVSRLQAGMKYGAEGSRGLNFHKIFTLGATQISLPTTCVMHRPAAH